MTVATGVLCHCWFGNRKNIRPARPWFSKP